MDIRHKDISSSAQPPSPLAVAEAQRMSAWDALPAETRRAYGQYFTPEPLAAFIASRITLPATSARPVRVLDPGAGVGSLGVALLQRLVGEMPGTPLHVTAVEVDGNVLPALENTRTAALAWARAHGVELEFDVVHGDFIEWAAGNIAGIYQEKQLFDLVVMNPPYAKIAARGKQRALTARVACEVGNLYAAFVALSVESLREGGRLVAITPRSFTNGPYFRPFREYLDKKTAFETVDLFESRSTLFADTDVLQENVIYSLVRSARRPATVNVSFHGRDGMVEDVAMSYEDFMPSSDPQRFIHLRNGDEDHETAQRINTLPCTLAQLGLQASTGRVVDFRSRDHLRTEPGPDSVPLLYPQHLRNGAVIWPVDGKKPNALAVNSETQKMLVPRGHYVAIKRFTSKEERRRVAPTWVPDGRFDDESLAFENKLNVIHADGAGLDRDLAVGITLYLACTTLDTYFRQFSGHTQVNATDLRSLRYPDAKTLRYLGQQTSSPSELDQDGIDALIEGALWGKQ